MTEQDSSKRCFDCGATKRHSEFYRNRSRSDGLDHCCKACQKVRYEANRQAEIEYRRAHYEANKKSYREARRRHYEENRESYAVRDRKSRKANPEAAALKSRRRAALKLGAEGSHTVDEVLAMYDDQNGLCAYCETPLFGSYEVDHMVPLCKGGRDDWENLAIVCRPCNRRKSGGDLMVFLVRLGFPAGLDEVTTRPASTSGGSRMLADFRSAITGITSNGCCWPSSTNVC